MARISTYAIDGTPTVNDKVIGTDVDNLDVTMNYTIGDIIALVPGGKSSVQSLNTLTGDLTLVGAGGNIVTVSGTTITITGTSGSGGITSINTTATGPNVNLEGKGGLVVTEVGNIVFLDTTDVGGLVTSLTTAGTSGASTLIDGVLNIPDYATGGGGGTPGTPLNGIQVNTGGSFGAYDYLISNPFSQTLDLGNGSIGKVGNVAGIVNIFNSVGDRNQYGSVRFYDYLSNSNYVGIIGPGSMEKAPSYDIALPNNEPLKGQVMSVKEGALSSPWELEWTSPSSGGGGGTVTDVSVLVNGGVTDAISLRVFDSTTTPRIELDFQGVSGQYINGLGVLTTSDFMTTLTTNGTSGPAEYDASTNTLNIPTITGGGGSTAPGGSNTQIQYNNNNAFDGNVGFTLDTATAGITKVQIGKSDDPTFRYGVLRLEGNSSSEGGKIEFETGAGRAAAAIVTLQAPEAGTKQEISLPDALPTADTQILGIKSISGTDVQTQWETPTGGAALPYFSYEAMWSSNLGVVTVTVLNNTTSRTFIWTDNKDGTITVSASATMPTGILVLLNGYGPNKDTPVQSFYGGYTNNRNITINILSSDFVQTDAEIVSGNFELRLYG